MWEVVSIRGPPVGECSRNVLALSRLWVPNGSRRRIFLKGACMRSSIHSGRQSRLRGIRGVGKRKHGVCGAPITSHDIAEEHPDSRVAALLHT